MNCIGIEIGGTKLQLVAGSADRIIDRRHFVVDVKAGAEGIRLQISSVLSVLIEKHSAQAVGVGFGGPVDWERGIIGCSHQIDGWADFQIGNWLAKQTGLPVRVDNDANVAALSEAKFGSGAKLNPVFYITLGSGVGGGLVVDGAIYHGAKWGEAEIGQMRLNREGMTVESRCAGWAVDQRIRAARATHPDSVMFPLIGSETRGEARHLAVGLFKQDVLAQEILAEVGEDLAFALSHVVHLMHPEVIVLGGGLSLVGEPLLAAVGGALSKFLMNSFRPGPTVAFSSLKEDAVPIGALLLAASALPTGSV